MNLLEEEYGIWEGFEYKIRKPTNTLVKGMGINDSPFIIQPTIAKKQIIHPAYVSWANMLKRCYSSNKQSMTVYRDVTCCAEWLLFTNFAKWFKNNYVSGYHLDKDLLIKGNRMYSPNTCIFLPQDINNFLILSNNSMGLLPIGVSATSGKYVAGMNSKGYLGRFNTPEEAHKAWQKAKLEQAIAFNFPPLQRVIDQLKFEIENNLETISL